MTDIHMPVLRAATEADWPFVERLLNEAKLPVEDLGPERMSEFLVAEDGDTLAGIIGLELHENIGLLRSLVVAPAARRLGLGGKLAGALEAAAEAAGLDSLWLLTIDASAFFERQGFVVVERINAPERIQQSREFSELCPGTAVLMSKRLRQA